MNVTIVLPSLNPDEKLLRVIDGLLREGFTDIVLVDDGSDPAHLEPFRLAAAHPEVTLLTHEVNRGKGRAMKTAFAYILEHRPNTAGVVTVDGDDQHASHDIRACAQRLLEEGDKVILGCRDFSGPDVPLKSRLGNRITSGVFRLFCGLKISDTQTGLRAIPFCHLPLMCQVEGERYEYETEMFFALRREHIGLVEVTIDTVYLDGNSSSHFHPIHDSAKIYRMIAREVRRKPEPGADPPPGVRFITFMLSSGAAFLIDYGLFSLLVFLLEHALDRGPRLFIATFGARIVSSLFNFTVNRRAVFHSDAPVGASLVRYYALCVAQALASYGLVYLFSALLHAGSPLEVLLKLVVDALLFLLSYQIQHRYVFQ